MAEDIFEEEEKKVDEDCDVKNGVAKEHLGFIKHPIRTIKKSKEDHPIAWSVGTLAVIGGGLIGTYILGRYSVDQQIFEPVNTNPEIPSTDIPTIEADPAIATAPEVVETAAEVVNQ